MVGLDVGVVRVAADAEGGVEVGGGWRETGGSGRRVAESAVGVLKGLEGGVVRDEPGVGADWVGGDEVGQTGVANGE